MNDFEVACSMVDNYTGDSMQENVIEWVNSETATVNFVATSRFANNIRKLAEEHEEVKILSDDKGVLLAHVPVKWIRIYPPKQLSDEYRAELSSRMSERNGVKKP